MYQMTTVLHHWQFAKCSVQNDQQGISKCIHCIYFVCGFVKLFVLVLSLQEGEAVVGSVQRDMIIDFEAINVPVQQQQQVLLLDYFVIKRVIFSAKSQTFGS